MGICFTQTDPNGLQLSAEFYCVFMVLYCFVRIANDHGGETSTHI